MFYNINTHLLLLKWSRKLTDACKLPHKTNVSIPRDDRRISHMHVNWLWQLGRDAHARRTDACKLQCKINLLTLGLSSGAHGCMKITIWNLFFSLQGWAQKLTDACKLQCDIYMFTLGLSSEAHGLSGRKSFCCANFQKLYISLHKWTFVSLILIWSSMTFRPHIILLHSMKFQK